MIIRPATIDDLDIIVEFNIAMAFETEHLVLDRARVVDGVRAVLTDPVKGRYVVAEEGGIVIGQLMVTYEWSDWRNGMFWWIQSVYVDKRCRGQKVFSQLYTYMKTEALAHGSCGMRLYVEEQNVHAQQTYKKLGMTLTMYEMMEEDFVLKRA
jgi:ribosomal protein S18 acetylase RimI-like enzyme